MSSGNITDKGVRNIVMECKRLKYLDLSRLRFLSSKLFHGIKETTQIELILDDVQESELNNFSLNVCDDEPASKYAKYSDTKSCM